MTHEPQAGGRVPAPPPHIRSKTPLRDYQKEDFVRFVERPAALIAWGMGLGKSLLAITLAVNRNHRRVLIACPDSVIGVWPKQFATHAAEDYTVVPLRKGSVADKQQHAAHALKMGALYNQRVALVISHESLWRVPFGEWALTAGFDFFILDEGHRGWHPSGKMSKYLYHLGQVVPYKVSLTGTPLPRGPLSCFSQFRLLDPSIFGRYWTHFVKQYAITQTVQKRAGGSYPRVIEDPEEKGLSAYQRQFLCHAQAELKRKFHILTTVRTKDELNLPQEIDLERTCELSPQARKMYTRMQRDFYVWLESSHQEVTATNILTKMLRLQQISSGFIKTDLGAIDHLGTHKEDLLLDVLEDLNEPVVVFAWFREELHAIQRVAEKLGRRYGEVSGARKDLTSESTMPDTIDVLGAQFQSGSVGCDFTRAAIDIMYSPTYSLTNFDQARSRTHRPGQTQSVCHIRLVAEHTMDEIVYAALHARREVTEAILLHRTGHVTT